MSLIIHCRLISSKYQRFTS